MRILDPFGRFVCILSSAWVHLYSEEIAWEFDGIEFVFSLLDDIGAGAFVVLGKISYATPNGSIAAMLPENVYTEAQSSLHPCTIDATMCILDIVFPRPCILDNMSANVEGSRNVYSVGS
ncbi:MAG: hypothetical protein CL920_35040 [Deltaproteobacteria bacterium]|nr:hypothetical protein [Deltaproteobacteria bacterium]